MEKLFKVWLFLFLFGIIWYSIASANSIKQVDQRRIDLINNTIEQYKKDNNRDWSCSIDWTKVSINSIIFWKVANESGYGTKWAWAKYNNRGNLKYAWSAKLPKQQEQGKSTKDIDWKWYFIYEKTEDWIYDMVERNKRRWWGKCNIDFESTFMYLRWTNAPRNTKNIEDTNRYLLALKDTVLSYEKNKQLYLVDNDYTQKQASIINWIDEPMELNKWKSNEKLITKWTPKVQVKKVCTQIHTIKEDWSYIQIDRIHQFLNWILWLKKNDTVFICKKL